MKYRAVYEVIEKHRENVPNLSVTDMSGWKNYQQSYASRCRPLWIVVEDPVAHRRYWITHDKPDLEIVYQRMDDKGSNIEPAFRFKCSSRTQMAEKLGELLQEGVMSNQV